MKIDTFLKKRDDEESEKEREDASEYMQHFIKNGLRFNVNDSVYVTTEHIVNTLIDLDDQCRCAGCGGSHDGLIECDICLNGWHLSCLRHGNQPVDDEITWKCPMCTGEVEVTSNASYKKYGKQPWQLFQEGTLLICQIKCIWKDCETGVVSFIGQLFSRQSARRIILTNDYCDGSIETIILRKTEVLRSEEFDTRIDKNDDIHPDLYACSNAFFTLERGQYESYENVRIHKAKKLKLQECARNEDGFIVDIPLGKDPRYYLSTSFKPRFCARTPDMDKIKYRVENFLKSSTGSNLLVTGRPGTGKTTSTRHVLQEINSSAEYNIDYFEINCLNLLKAGDVLKRIYGFFGEYHVPQHLVLDHINYHLTKLTKPLVIILDEADALVKLDTKKQIIILILINLSIQHRLMLICISNDINFLDSTKKKVASRIQHSICFHRLNEKDLHEIVASRLKFATESACIFKHEALAFAARRISKITGDVRSMLKVCSSAFDAAINNSTDVSISVVQEALDTLYCNPYIKAIRSASLLEKMVMVSVINLQMNSNDKKVSVANIAHKCDVLQHQLKLEIPNLTSMAIRSIHSLHVQSIIFVNDLAKRGNGIVSLSENITKDDIIEALNSESDSVLIRMLM